VRRFDAVDAQLIPGTENAVLPFWSADGRSIGFFDPRGVLKRVTVAGGNPQTIVETSVDPRGMSWGPDDTILLGAGYDGLYRVAATGGQLQPVTSLDSSRQEGSHRWPQFLPDGRHYVFTVRSGLAEQRGVYLGSLDDPAIKRPLIHSDTPASFAAPGYLLFLNEDTLLAQSFDTERLELRGQATPLATRVGRSSRGDGAFSLSGAGRLAFAGSRFQTGRLTWFDRNGTALGVVGPDGDRDVADYRISPDETRLALSLIDPKLSLPDIWFADLARGGMSRFTSSGPNLNASPVWSPDGSRVAFRTNRKGLTELYQRSAGTGGTDQPLMLEDVARAAGAGLSNIQPSDWSPDGKHIVFSVGIPSDLWLLPTGGNSPPTQLTRSPSDQMHANFSPDGRFIAYTSNESGRYEVYVETLPLSDRKWPISTTGGYEPRWRADGREIYYLAEDRRLMAVQVTPGAAAPFGVPRPLFQTQVYAEVSMLRTHYVPNRDGSRFLIQTRSGDPDPASITVVLNWAAGLNK
jgi:Tol biopolymer transport system component